MPMLDEEQEWVWELFVKAASQPLRVGFGTIAGLDYGMVKTLLEGYSIGPMERAFALEAVIEITPIWLEYMIEHEMRVAKLKEANRKNG